VRALFARAGVDYDQWKAISRTLLRADFRPPGPNAESYSLRTVGGLLLMVLIYGLFGLGAAVITVMNGDVLLTGIVTLSYLGMLLVTALLAQHSAAIVSTTDYAVLAPLPVSSHTFLAVRLTNILFHTTLLTTLMAYPPIAAFTVAYGVSFWRGFAAAAAIYAFSFAITFALVALYGTLLRVFGAARLQKALGYAQTLIGVAAYGGVVLVLQFVGRQTLGAATMPREPWLLLVPPAWFASYLEIATGVADWNAWVRAAMSIGFLGAMAALLRGPLGIEYAERLGQLASAAPTQTAPKPVRAALLFTRDEARAVALLVRAHFRHDLRVRLGVLALLPLTLLYMFLGARDGRGGDPFTAEGARSGDLIALAVLFFPTIVVQQFSASEAYRAAWIYFATPANRAALIVSLKNVIVTFFLLPYVAFLAVAFTWRFGHLGHALVHAGFMGLIGHLALQTGALVEPRLPFALPPKKSANSAAMFAWMLIVMIAGNALLFFLVHWVYGHWWRVGSFAVALVAVSALMNAAIRPRSSRRYESFEFS
jgi:hypothetical protein